MENDSIDFVVGLPKILGKFNSISVVVDRFTKSAYIIHVIVGYNAKQLPRIYVKEILRMHSVPVSIILYRGTFLASNVGEEVA